MGRWIDTAIEVGSLPDLMENKENKNGGILHELQRRVLVKMGIEKKNTEMRSVKL
jgi:hypothetical protein